MNMTTMNQTRFVTKTATILLITQFLGLAVAVPAAAAQTQAGTGVGASGYGYASPGTVTASGSSIVVPPTIAPSEDSGFLQFNNLTVESVSGTNPPAEILASNPNIYPYPLLGGASSAGTAIAPSATKTVLKTALGASLPSARCYKFDSQNGTAKRAVDCPQPKAAPATAASSTSTQSAPNITTSGNAASPMIYPPTYPIRSQPYRIEVDASTRLMLRDRTAATLQDFGAGDQINLFGYYNSDGTIQVYLIRDLSKPAQDEFLQLGNVELASISTTTGPATLIVVQKQGYPCYGFGAGRGLKMPIVCPMGVQGTDKIPLQSTSIPAAIMPNWQILRKYMINLDTQTIILDANRTTLSLSDLRVGDRLNIYGDTTDNGQTLKASIIRDLSIPPTPTQESGTITQVNADGSFVIQTNDGQTVTVQSPIQVGAMVQLTGLLDRMKNMFTHVSSLYFGGNENNGIPVPTPMMYNASSKLHVQAR